MAGEGSTDGWMRACYGRRAGEAHLTGCGSLTVRWIYVLLQFCPLPPHFPLMSTSAPSSLPAYCSLTDVHCCSFTGVVQACGLGQLGSASPAFVVGSQPTGTVLGGNATDEVILYLTPTCMHMHICMNTSQASTHTHTHTHTQTHKAVLNKHVHAHIHKHAHTQLHTHAHKCAKQSPLVQRYGRTEAVHTCMHA